MDSSKSLHLLAEGELNWDRGERVSDRYGSIFIQVGGEYARSQEDLLRDLPSVYATFPDAPVGAIGRLLVEVTVARNSFHIGDLDRGVGPQKPEVGEQIVLGNGELFTEEKYDIPSIGVRPADGRKTEWMSVPALYRAHLQTVKLYFESESTSDVAPVGSGAEESREAAVISTQEQGEKSKITPIQLSLVANTHLEGTNMLELLERVELSTDSDGNIKSGVIESLKTMFKVASEMTPDDIARMKFEKMLAFLQAY